MRIVIDMQGVQTESRLMSIGRYSLSYAKAIVRNRGDHQVILALSGLFPDTIEPIRAAFDGLLPQKNIRVWYAPGPVREGEPGNQARREAAELIREAFMASLRPDVIHISNVYEGFLDDAVISIGLFDRSTPVSVSYYYDPILANDSERLPNTDYLFKQYYRRRVDYLRRAARCLTISDFSCREVVDILALTPTKCANVSAAVDECFQPRSIDETAAQSLLEKYGIARPFLLCSGDTSEQKNLAPIVEAYRSLPENLRSSYSLVFARRANESDISTFSGTQFSEGTETECFIHVDYVAEEELIQLYNLSQICIVHSIDNGFDLAVLEAMACGRPVVCAKIASLPEFVRNSAALYDPFDVADIAKKIERALIDERFRQELCLNGQAQIKRFDWNKTAQISIREFECISESKHDAFVAPEALLEQITGMVSGVIDSSVSESDLYEMACSIDRNFPEKSLSQFYVDISDLIKRDHKTGIQRVARSVLNHLISAPPDGYVVRPVYATIDQPGYRYARRSASDGAGWVEGGEAIALRPGDVFLGLDLQHHTTIAQEKYLLSARAYGVRIYFVVYDLLPIQFPDYWPPEHSVAQVHSDWLSTVCKFDGVVCISRSVSEELQCWLKKNGPNRLRPLKTTWFHLGADLSNSVPTTGYPIESTAVLELIRLRPSFLIVGTLEPRKGIAQTLDAFEIIWREGGDVNLVLVGKQGWMVEMLAQRIRSHTEFGSRLLWLEGVSDEYLDKIYTESVCLIAASEGEGFGLPLIEAAQNNLPILARDIPVFREVARDSAYYFKAVCGRDLATAVRDWLSLYAQEKHPKSNSMRFLTWEESTRQLVGAILQMESFNDQGASYSGI